MRLEIDVLVWRGAIPESRHRIQAVAVSADGRVAFETAQTGLITSFRSAAKPFQALPLVERGHAKRWLWSDEELAVMCASHTGSPYHVALVSRILDRIGLSAANLACGYHEPIDPESLEHVRAHPESRSRLYNNCSGKHAGMLCLALSEGWPVSGYERADHPLQQLMRRTVAEVCGVDPEAMAVAVDGCGVSVFGLSLAAMARGYARLAAADPAGDARERALHRIRSAMVSHPRAVGGAGRLSTRLMEAGHGALVAKGGAEGLECAALVRDGIGLVVKAEDGAERALGPATVALLDRFELFTASDREGLEDVARPRVENHAKLEVGVLEATIRIREAAAPGSEPRDSAAVPHGPARRNHA